MLRRRGMLRGQIVPFVALLIAMLLGIAALAVDLGYLRYHQRIQQTATDSAAIAGAAEKYAGTDFVAGAKQDASSNGFTDNGGTIKITAVSPPATGNYTSDHNAVEVNITYQQPTFFSRVFGVSTATTTTRAVATIGNGLNSPPCMMTLDTSGNNFNQATINAPNCDILLNGTTDFTGASVNVASVKCAVGANCHGLTSPTPVTVSPATDPCYQISGCAYFQTHAPSTSGCTSFKSSTANVTVSPGCYSGLDVSGATNVTFNCGLYVITGNLNANKGGNQSVTSISQTVCPGNGVTFYITGSGKIDMVSQNFNLSAPASGSGDYSMYSQGEQNVLFYQDPNDNSNVNVQQASCAGTCVGNLSGLVYFPTQQVNYNKTTANASGSGPLLLVFGHVNGNKGNVTIDSSSISGNNSFVKRPVLVE